MSALATRRMPVMFALSGAQAIPGIHGPLGIAGEASGVVVLAARRFERPGTASLGAHVMSPVWLSATPLEERVAKALRGAGVEVPLSNRVPSTLPLPSGLTGTSVPVVVLTLNLALGLERLAAIGSAVRGLRHEGVVFVGVAHDGIAAFGRTQMLAAVSLLLGATYEDDRVAELGTRDGALGFILVPESDDAIQDDGCCFWNAEAAGEMPLEVVQQLRPYLLNEQSAAELIHERDTADDSHL